MTKIKIEKVAKFTGREKEIAEIVKGFDTDEDAKDLYDRLERVSKKLGIDPATGQTDDEIKERILEEIQDCLLDFFLYDRKEDESLPRGAIEKAVCDGIITVEEIQTAFYRHIEENLYG